MKRSAPESQALVKKTKAEEERSLIEVKPQQPHEKRTSSLTAPIMQLEGHEGAVYCCRFNPNGNVLASGSYDKNLFLWRVYGDCQNYLMMKGHKGAILDLDWSRDGSQIITASTDKFAAIWDAEIGERVRKLRGHSSYVNSASSSRKGSSLFCTSSDDRTVKVWDSRVKNPVKSFESKYQVTSACFNETDDQIFAGGIDNCIKVWDLRKGQVSFKMAGHTDTVTSLRLSPDGSNLLSNSMDNTAKIWDVKPFVAGERCLHTFEGAINGSEKNLVKACWSPDGSRVMAGSGDRNVVIWDVSTQRILYRLPGHKGCVNDVDYHSKEPIIVS